MHAGYRRPGPIYRWRNWWRIVLIADEEAEEERRILAAEDEAIAAAEAGPQPAPADLAALTEILADGRATATLPAPDGSREG